VELSDQGAKRKPAAGRLRSANSKPTNRSAAVIPRLLRTREAANYLGMSGKAVRALIMAGRLPYVHMKAGNSPFLLDRADLDRFIEANKTPAAIDASADEGASL
jgi:excisionase family DNA binding protein